MAISSFASICDDYLSYMDLMHIERSFTYLGRGFCNEGFSFSRTGMSFIPVSFFLFIL
jgi:hypothetical protein